MQLGAYMDISLGIPATNALINILRRTIPFFPFPSGRLSR